MSLKNLIELEHENWKNRMIYETGGGYILTYLGYIFIVLMSVMFGFKYEKDDVSLLLMLFLCIMVIYQSASVYLTTVKEKGKRVNIFEKYIHIPVDFSMLCVAKLICIVKNIAFPVLGGQVAALMIRAIDPDKQGGSFFDVALFIPVIAGALFLIIKAIEFMLLSRKVMR